MNFKRLLSFILLLTFLHTSTSIAQVEVSLLPINMHFKQKLYKDAFRKLKPGVRKTHYPIYEKDATIKLEQYLKEYFTIKNVELIDFPMEKMPTEELSNITRLSARLDIKMMYEKSKKTYRQNLNFYDLIKLNKKKPQKIAPSLVLSLAEKTDQPYLLYVKATGHFYRSKKQENNDAPYRENPNGYLLIDVALLDSKTGKVIKFYYGNIGRGQRNTTYMTDKRYMTDKSYKLVAKKLARKIKKTLQNHKK